MSRVIVDVRMERFAESKTSISTQLNTLKEQIDTTQLNVDRIGSPRTSQEESELRDLEAILAQYRSSYANLVQSYENVRLVELQTLDNIAIARPAKVPTEPFRSNLLTNILLGFVIGFSIVLTFVSLIEYLDDRIRTPEALTELSNSTLLGSVERLPKVKGTINGLDSTLLALHEPLHPIAESFRTIRTNLRFASLDHTLDTLIITSPETGEGKSTTTANLAISLAQGGQRILLIDADLRRPRQHRLFNLSQRPGLSEMLFDQEGKPWDHVLPTIQENLYLLTSGQKVPNPADLLGSQRFEQLLNQLNEEVDLILIDTPPILPVSDALVLASQAKNVMLIIHANRSRKQTTRQAFEALRKVGVDPLGVVLNQLKRGSSSQYAYYGNDDDD